jgi:hypothetical protein
VVLSGKLRDSLLVLFKPATANAMISKRKFNNYELYKTCFPECAFMWFGDSGQGDVEVGARMMADPIGSCLGAFIQDVATPDGVSLLTKASERRKELGRGVDIVDNYVEAAYRMFERGFLSAEGLARTTASAVQDLLAIREKFTSRSALIARLGEMRRHVKDVNRLLAAKLGDQFVPIPMAVLC